MNRAAQRKRQRGFSMIEIVIVLVIAFTLAAIAVPGFLSMERFLRISGDARNIAGTIAQAKMRAAASFTQARVFADLAANTYRIEVWKKPVGAVAGSWQTEGGIQVLSTGDTLGFGAAGAPPPNTQAAIGMAPVCFNGLNATGGAIAGTACVVFNSRGVPIDATGAPTANDALYVTNGSSVYGVTVAASGLIQSWSTDDNIAWLRR